MTELFCLFRLPVDAYNDGEVSFSLAKSVKRQLVFSRIAEEFSDDEDDILADADAANIVAKKSIVGRFFASFLSLVLLPLVFIFRLFAGMFRAAARFVTTATRGWETTKTDYKTFMSTSNVKSTEVFTDDDDDDAQLRRERLIQAVPSKVLVSKNILRRFLSFVTSSVTSFVPNVSQTSASAAEETWFEVIIIRRIVRIFR